MSTNVTSLFLNWTSVRLAAFLLRMATVSRSYSLPIRLFTMRSGVIPEGTLTPMSVTASPRTMEMAVAYTEHVHASVRISRDTAAMNTTEENARITPDFWICVLSSARNMPNWLSISFSALSRFAPSRPNSCITIPAGASVCPASVSGSSSLRIPRPCCPALGGPKGVPDLSVPTMPTFIRRRRIVRTGSVRRDSPGSDI